MSRRFIDISAPLQNDVPADPPGFGPKIEYVDHQQSLPQILPLFPGLKKEDLPEGQGWAVERVQLSTHNGTHLDAPWHYHPTMNEGERAWTIDEIPLEWCFPHWWRERDRTRGISCRIAYPRRLEPQTLPTSAQR